MNRSDRTANLSSDSSDSNPRQTSLLIFLTDLLGSREELSRDRHPTEQGISGRNLVQLMLNRTLSSSVPEEEPVQEAFISRRSRRRRYHYYDEQAESYDELINPVPDEEYVDFRTYPLMIDWKEIENDESEAYDIYEKYGYLGVSCFSSLSRNTNIKFSDKFYKNLINFYVNNFEINKSESIKNIDDLIQDLPSLQQIKKIIFHNLVSKKELLLIKLILDIYLHYLKAFDGPLYKRLLREYIPCASFFYSSLSDEDTDFINEKIFGMKELSEILQIKMCENRETYLKNLNKLKRNMLKIIGGSKLKQFII